MFNPDFTDQTLMRKPNEESGRQAKLLMKIIEKKYQVSFNSFRDFQRWSTDNLCEFWKEFWDFLGMISSKKFHKVIDLKIPMRESPKWFEGARLNYSENLLRYRDDRIALIQDGEDSQIETYTFAQMYERSKLYAAAFRKFGLKKNDIVACYMSNRKEAVFAMQAVTSIGAIWTGALPLLGSEAIVNRFKQVNPRILLTVDRFVHDGEEIDMLLKVKNAVQNLTSIEKVLILKSKSDSKDISGIRNSCFLEDFLKLGVKGDGSIPDMQFEQVSFSHPVLIHYTSGTTGLPKAIVHGSGVLMSICSYLGVTIDTDRDSVWISVSPMGWASWSIYTALQFLGQTVLLFDGNPYYLTPTYIWDLIDKHKISHILFPSSVLDELEKRKYVPTEKHNLSSLQYTMAGGSVVKRGTFDFMNKILPHAAFTGAYGSTEVMGCCLLSEMSLPLHKAEINVACLGTAVEIVDETGHPVLGEIGEVVLSKPIPGLALGLWGDEDGSAFREKYYSKYHELFAMGDSGAFNPHTGGWIICCRSDETLKQRGCRFGSSEIYNVVETLPEVRDSLCVSHYNKQRDESAVLFLKIKYGYGYSEKLVKRIREAIEKALTVRHVPDIIIEVPDIPVIELLDELKILHVNDDTLKVVLSRKVAEVRPYIVCCKVLDVNLAKPESLKKFITVQTKLHDGICDKRNAATIATHDLAKITGDLFYDARSPNEIKIKPLNRKKEVTAAELYSQLNDEADAIRKEKKKNTYSGIHKYLYMLKDKPIYPCLVDSSGLVISFPPITNSEGTKISDETKNILLEVTGMNLNTCKKVMDVLLIEMLKLGLGNPDIQTINVEESESQQNTLTVRQVKVVDEEGQLKVVYPSRTDIQTDDISVTRT